MANIVIKNAIIIDGSNTSPFCGDVAIDGDKIIAVGNLSHYSAANVIDGTNKILCPGFIDIHTHSDFSIHFDQRAESQIRQGVTTQIVGLCGYSNAPITKELAKEIIIPQTIQPTWESFQEYLSVIEEQKTATNLGFLIGHGTLRILAMPKENRIREATKQEISVMQNILEKCFHEGAIGLSTGFEYFPGRGAKNKEILSLLEIVNKYHTIHACHTKNRDLFALSSFTEAIELAKNSHTKLQISHVNCKFGRLEKTMERFLTICNWYREEGVEIGLDVIPSIWNHANITALLPIWALNLSTEKLLNVLQDESMHKKLMENDEPFMQLHIHNHWDKIFIFDAHIHKEHIGKSIAEIAEIFQCSPWQVVFKLLVNEKEFLHSLMFIGDCFNHNDIKTALTDPFCCVCSDSVAQAIDGITKDLRITPDSFTWAERFILDYTKKTYLLSLQEAIYKLTGLPAKLANIKQRGLIKENYFADIVLLDMEALGDTATFTNFATYPQGVELVIVNGEIAYQNNTRTASLTGKVLKR